MTDPRQAARKSESAAASAREKSAQMRAERAAAAKRQERNKRIVMILGGLVVVGLIVAIGWAISNAGGDKPARSSSDAAPANVVDGHAIPVGEEDAPVTVDLYFDYMCPACGGFEQVNGDDLDQLLEDGTIKINLRVLNFLDSTSRGTEYSTRAGNAVATVANYSPEFVWDFHRELYANQPQEGTTGLSDDELVDIATEVGVSEDVAARFAEGTYDNWVSESNDAAGEDGVSSTPTLMIDGEQFTASWGEPGAVRSAIEAAAE